MMFNDASDPLLRDVSGLPVLSPDHRRAERVRARCRARLERPAPGKKGALGHAVFAGLCLAYLSAVVLDVLRLRGMF